MSLIIRDKSYSKTHPKAVPLARIEDSTELNRKLIYLIQDEEKGEQEIKLTKGKIVVLPRLDRVEKIYVSGVSGAGKSYWCSSWLKELLKKSHKDDPVYLFSSVSYDKNLDDVFPDNIERIPIDAELVTDPIDPESLEDCCVMMDDVDSIKGGQIKSELIGLRDTLLEIGRHTNCRMLITSHVLRNYKATLRVINEAHTTVLFPKASGRKSIRTYLSTYCELTKAQIDRFFKIKSRWVSVSPKFDRYLMHEKGIIMLNEED